VWIGDPLPLQFAGGSFYDPFAWTPIGAPIPGDVLTIQDGSPQVIDQMISGLTIALGGSNNDSGSALWWDALSNGSWESYSAPNPTLRLSNATIGADTTIDLPGVVNYFHSQPPNTATILAQGAENYGTIAATNGLFSNGTTLYLSLNDGGSLSYDAPWFVNRGTITADNGATIVMSGYSGDPRDNHISVHPFGTLEDDGVINVRGIVSDKDLSIVGSGTIDLGDTPNALGLSEGPSKFIFTGENGLYGSVLSASQTIDFQGEGGELVLGRYVPNDPWTTLVGLQDFQGKLADFGWHANDKIELNGFTENSMTYANGVLSLNDGTNAGGLTLNFANLPEFGHFVATANGNATDITWQDIVVNPHSV
jgi:hypothetical protein